MRRPQRVMALLFAATTAVARKGAGRGGSKWSTASLKAVDTDLCTIERLPASQVSPQRFESEFRGKKPVVLQGLSHDEGYSLQTGWQKRTLLKKYGSRNVRVRHADEADGRRDRMRQNNGQGGSRTITLKEYIETVFDASPVPANAPLSKMGDINYQFDRDFLKNSAPEMRDDFGTPAHFERLTSNDTKQDPLFYLGPRGSGVGFHRHGEAWNIVAHGRKRWFLYPPEWRSDLLGVGPDIALDGLGWFREFFSRVGGTTIAPMECVQEAGDIAYLPEGWHHATLNVQDTIGVAFNHLPKNSGVLKLDPPDFHWGIAPTHALKAGAIEDSEAARSVACAADALDGRRESLSTACAAATVHAATALLAEYRLHKIIIATMFLKVLK